MVLFRLLGGVGYLFGVRQIGSFFHLGELYILYLAATQALRSPTALPDHTLKRHLSRTSAASCLLREASSPPPPPPQAYALATPALPGLLAACSSAVAAMREAAPKGLDEVKAGAAFACAAPLPAWQL